MRNAHTTYAYGNLPFKRHLTQKKTCGSADRNINSAPIYDPEGKFWVNSINTVPGIIVNNLI